MDVIVTYTTVPDVREGTVFFLARLLLAGAVTAVVFGQAGTGQLPEDSACRSVLSLAPIGFLHGRPGRGHRGEVGSRQRSRSG